MKTRVLLQVGAGLALLVLPMCQVSDGPVAAGLMVAADPVADDALYQARALMAQGKYGKAESLLDKLVASRPFAPCMPEVHFALGDVYYAQENYRDSFDQYGKVVERYQGSSLYADALNRQLAMATSAADGKLKTPVLFGAWHSDMESSVVKDWLMAIIRNAPYNEMSATAMSVLGRYLVKIEETDEACAIFTKLVEDYPHSPYAPEAQLMVANLWATSRNRGNNNDLVNLHKAQLAYEEFTLRFPNHPDAKKAMEEVSNVKRLLVRQQLEVGRYYLERSHEYGAAAFCFEDVIRQESVNPEAAAEARRLLPKARKAGETSH